MNVDELEKLHETITKPQKVSMLNQATRYEELLYSDSLFKYLDPENLQIFKDDPFCPKIVSQSANPNWFEEFKQHRHEAYSDYRDVLDFWNPIGKRLTNQYKKGPEALLQYVHNLQKDQTLFQAIQPFLANWAVFGVHEAFDNDKIERLGSAFLALCPITSKNAHFF